MGIGDFQTAAKALSDGNRLRMLLLLREEDLCVCQIMGVLGLSQPLVSRHLAVLKSAGFLTSRREGKLVIYRLAPLSTEGEAFVALTVAQLGADAVIRADRERLGECTELQKRTGRCDVELFAEYVRNKTGEAPTP